MKIALLIVPAIAILPGEIPSAMAQQNGYGLTVNVPSRVQVFHRLTVKYCVQLTYRLARRIRIVSVCILARSITFFSPKDQTKMIQVSGYAAQQAEAPLTSYSFERREPRDHDVMIDMPD